MARKNVILTDKAPYHLVNRSNNKEFFYLPLPILWEISIECLAYLSRELQFRIHAFVLMSNHYHLILSTPMSNLSDGMTYFNREIAKRANDEANRINHFFGGRYKWCLIYDESYYWQAIKYVFRNPLEAQICPRVEDYPYSSLNHPELSSLFSLTDFFYDNKKNIDLDLDWLNESFEPQSKEALKKGLRRTEFKLPRNESGNTRLLYSPQRKK